MSQIPVLTAARILRALEHDGFYIHHAKGSHYALRHPVKKHLRVTLPFHGGDLKRGTLRSILDQADLSVDEFLKLL